MKFRTKNSIFHVCACFPLEHLTTNGEKGRLEWNLETEERTKRNLLREQAQVTMLRFTNNLPLAVSRHRFENYFCVASIYLHTIELTISLSPFSPSPPFSILSFHKAPTAHNSVFKSMLTDRPTKPIKNTKTLKTWEKQKKYPETTNTWQQSKKTVQKIPQNWHPAEILPHAAGTSWKIPLASNQCCKSLQMKKQHLLLHWLLLACCWLDHVHADMAAYAFLIQKLWQTFLHDWHHENQVPGKYAHLLHINCFFWQKAKNTGQDLLGILVTVFVLLSHLPCPVLLPEEPIWTTSHSHFWTDLVLHQ